MAFEFRLPDVGEGVAEGELITWLVDVGDEVTEDQPLAEVETDKAMVEVPSPLDGTVKELLWEEGDLIPVGDVFITIEPAEEVDPEELDVEAEPEGAAAESGATGGAAAEGAADEGAAGTEEAAGEEPTDAAAGVATGPSGDGQEAAVPEGRVFAAPSARKLARELGVDLAAVDGTGPSGRVTERDVREHAEAQAEPTADESADAAVGTVEGAEGGGGGEPTAGAAEAAAGEPGTAAGGAPAGTATTVEPADRERTLAAPATRRVAEELRVDIDAVPTDEERDGEAFVTEEAVRQYAEAQQAAQAADAAAEAPAGAPAAGAKAAGAAATGAPAAGERVERIKYKGVRKTIGDAMVTSKFTAPHVTHHDTAVVDDLVATRERLKPVAEERGIRLTYMPFVMKAVVAALKQHPRLNAELDEEAGEIVRKYYYNIGVAAATDAGLMVPVVENVDGKGMLQISSEVNELVGKARDRSITREELQGSTFTVTNFGAIGGEYATPILNHPEVGILGIGELKQRPVVEDGEVVARYTLPISLTIDHRIVDGADAAQFANTVMEYLENPDLLLLE